MPNHKIEWTMKTWNPIVGCSKVSPGCKNCYAEKMARRLACMPQTKDKYRPVVFPEIAIPSPGCWNGTTFFDEKSLSIPFKTKKPTIFFVNSMGDVFHHNRFEDISKILEVIMINHQHQFIILTKRPGFANEFNDSWEDFSEIDNLWLGVSVENQETAEERIPILHSIPCKHKILSCEPLLGNIRIDTWKYTKQRCAKCGAIDSVITDRSYSKTLHKIGESCSVCGSYILEEITDIDWIIVGGETGTKARPMKPEWVNKIKITAIESGIPFFFKSWGEYKYNSFEIEPRYIGHKKTGDLIDGQQYHQFPTELQGYFK